ncbi:MAG: polysaccharide deacetylase family protein [Candidatus Thiodiazotropha sp. DIVDIV]
MMSLLLKALQEIKTRAYQSFVNDTRNIQLDQAIISVTFDDVPYSALENGLAILDQHSIKATFYIATGLCSPDDSNDPETDTAERFLNRDNIEQLNQSGHDIACHTHSHYRLDQGSADEMAQDAEKNIKTLSSWIKGKPIQHFSYPFGLVSFKAKKLLSKHYKTMRSSRPGINSDNSDFYLLRATSIYNPSFSKSTMSETIAETIKRGGWLVLYTHGVDDNPGPYDCTPEQLDWVLTQAVASGARILPVTEAYDIISKAPH